MPGREQREDRGVIALEREHRVGPIGVGARANRAIGATTDEESSVTQEEERPGDHDGHETRAGVDVASRTRQISMTIRSEIARFPGGPRRSHRV